MSRRSKFCVFAHFTAVTSVVLCVFATGCNDKETTQPTLPTATTATPQNQQETTQPTAPIATGEALQDAAKNGDLAQIKKLLSSGTPVDQKDRTGSTAMINASRNGYVDIVQLLLDKGAQVNSRDGTARGTPLIWAAYGNQDAVVRLLVKHGAEINATTADGMTALDAAIHADAKLTEATLRSFGAKANRGDGPVILSGLNENGDILLDNREHHSIRGCTITLSGGFKYNIGYFEARDRLAISANAFKRDDGASFRIESSKVPTIIAEDYSK